MDSMLFPGADALSELVSLSGAFAGYGLGLALAFWMLGYAFWFVIDLMRGGVG